MKETKMIYQTVLYEAVGPHPRFGWDYGNILFQSQVTQDPSAAMEALNNFGIEVKCWIATMKTIRNKVVIEEQMIDSSVILVD